MLGVDPKACVVFEDSAAGIGGAKAAGMRCVALARPGAPKQDVSAADLVLEDLAGFQPGLLAWRSQHDLT
jgi:beta-phosphoglucomutase-like phosphatase (HAD superfamily)